MMMTDRRKIMLCLVAAIGLALGSPMAGPAGAQTAGTDWTAQVTESDVGGHVMGNPAARLKLVEYLSYTCPHCAAFEAQGAGSLKRDFIAPGDLSIEIRNYTLNPIDFTIATLTRCGPPSKFFANHAMFLERQPQWRAKFSGVSAATRESWSTGSYGERMERIADYFGFDEMMRERGYSDSQISACLADRTQHARITAMTSHAARRLRLSGTPSFLLNGETLRGVHDWASLAPVLRRSAN